MLDVVAAVIIENNHVYIAQRINKGELANKWEFPGGKVEQGETHEEALIREMQEECGVVVVVNKKIDETYFKYETFDLNLTCYYSEIITGTLNSVVHQAQRFVSFSELKDIDFAQADLNAVNKIIKDNT